MTSYFQSHSQDTLPRTRPSPTISRHSISDPPEGEQATNEYRAESPYRNAQWQDATSNNINPHHGYGKSQREAGGDAPGMHPNRPSILQQGSILVKESLFADIKNDSIAMAGEFVGTILFLVISLGAAQSVSSVSSNISNNPQATSTTSDRLVANLYRALATGTALYGTASIFYRFTGSIFNPSVSLALCVCRVIKPVRFILVSTSQLLGGIVAAFILSGLLPGNSTINLELGDTTSITQGLFIEMFATTTLILTVLMLGVEKHTVTPHAPLGFGFTLLASTLFANQYTGAGINVSRALGTAVVEGFQPYHWIYWLGPTLGALLAAAFYEFLKLIKYWQVNPGQDSMEPLAPVVGMRYKKGMMGRTRSNQV